MFAGHYGVSLACKGVEQRLPLWLLFLAVQFVDILWSILILLGIEKVRIVPGITATNPFDLYYMPYTHSLAAAVAWSAVVFALCRWVIPLSRLRSNRSACFLAFAVFSHWVLDLVVHRPDLPLYDNAYKVGFGLWNFPLPALVLESAFLFLGTWFYLRSTTATSFAGRYGMIFFGLAILAVHCLLLWGPLPPSTTAGAVRLGALYLILAAAAYWMRMNGSPVPAQTMLGSAAAMASEPMEATGWPSKMGSQWIPASVDLKMPPEAAPT